MTRTVGGRRYGNAELGPDEDVLCEVDASSTNSLLGFSMLGRLYLTGKRLIWFRARFRFLGPRVVVVPREDIQRVVLAGMLLGFQTLLLHTRDGPRWFVLHAWPWDRSQKLRIKELHDDLKKVQGLHETSA